MSGFQAQGTMVNKEVKILLVEDNPGDAILFREYVKDFTFFKVDLHNAGSLAEAFAIEKKDFDVVLLDLTLPDSQGLDSLQKVIANFPDIPIVILTGLNDTDVAKSAVRLGAQDYLLKGRIDELLLEKTITYAIERTEYYKKALEVRAALRENQKLAMINGQLNRLIKQVERTNARLEEFAYVATHNLRAPVVNLKSLIDLFSSDKGKLEGRQKKVFDKIEITANNLSSTLQDLINIIAVTKKNVETKQNVRLEGLLKAVKENLELQIRSENATIITDFTEAPEIVYPKGHLESICQNMITNSIKYKSDKAPVIKIRSSEVDGFICLEFQDNGAGIDVEKNKDKLFKMFQRLSSDGEGKGLGLYIVKSQVERLGGKIELESKPMEGTTFKVYLKNDPQMDEERSYSAAG